MFEKAMASCIVVIHFHVSFDCVTLWEGGAILNVKMTLSAPKGWRCPLTVKKKVGLITLSLQFSASLNTLESYWIPNHRTNKWGDYSNDAENYVNTQTFHYFPGM